MKIQFRQVNEDSKFFGLHWSEAPHSACATLLSPQTKAAGTRLAALGLDTGAKFPMSTTAQASLHPLPGLQLLVSLPVGISSV